LKGHVLAQWVDVEIAVDLADGTIAGDHRNGIQRGYCNCKAAFTAMAAGWIHDLILGINEGLEVGHFRVIQIV
jgi:hypothetical protein